MHFGKKIHIVHPRRATYFCALGYSEYDQQITFDEFKDKWAKMETDNLCMTCERLALEEIK